MGARDRAASLLAGLALALLASSAAANGRFPRAQRLIQARQNPDVMALYGTYGLLVTRDAGATWRHVCEAATGTYAGEDPLLEIMPDERIVLRTDAGLGRSGPSLCSYDAVLGSANDALQDITRDSAGPSGLLALTTAPEADGALASRLSASANGGETFTPLGRVPPDVLGLGLTLDVAATRPELIYLSGFDDLGRGKLARSIDRGQSFVGFTISGLGVAAPPYIAAVSAIDPNRVFVRTDELQRSASDFEARETANDSLYFTPDGGATWHRTLTKRGKLFGFALSPDEGIVLAGFGDPVLAATFVEPEDLGLYRVALEDLVATPDAPPWERIYDRSVTCLRWTEHGLFACVAQDQNGFELGRAPDANFSLADAAPFEGLLRLPEVRPLECPVDTAGAACLLEETTGWVATCSVLRAACDLDAAIEPGPAEPGKAEAGAAGAVGSTGSPSDPVASTGNDGSTTTGAGGADPGATGSPSDRGGSAAQAGEAAARSPSGSCSTAPREAPNRQPSWVWLVALALLAARRRAHWVALFALAASSLGGCSDEPPSEAPPDARGSDTPPMDCGGAGEEFVLGMSKTAPSGSSSVAIVEADPAPPLKGPNAWTIQLSDESGEPITAADVSFSGWMPQHDHGLNALPLISERDGGRYEIKPIILYMPQLWELEVSVTRGDERESVSFSFCVP